MAMSHKQGPDIMHLENIYCDNRSFEEKKLYNEACMGCNKLNLPYCDLFWQKLKIADKT